MWGLNFNILTISSILFFQQAHWPTHMSTCAQNQSNQDEDGAPEPGESGHDAVQHFLSTSGAGSNASSRSNGLGSQSSRNMQPVSKNWVVLSDRSW